MRSDVGQPVEWIQLATMDSVTLHSPVEQQPAPSIRQAVVEYAEQAIEDGCIRREDSRLEWQLERRKFDS